jgi:hypothetical protein
MAAGSHIHAGTGYSYVSCYMDNATRLLPDNIYTSSALTLNMCYSVAAQKGYAYFGLQNSFYCYAGNSLQQATSLGPGVCDKTCGGDVSQTCGGATANSLYAVMQGKR